LPPRSTKFVDTQGRLLRTKEDNFDSINVSNLVSGLFMVQTETENGVVSIKLLKE